MKYSIFILLFLITYLFADSLFQVNENGVAVSGYDVVTYFELDSAIVGNESLSTQYKGVTWYFSDSKNLVLFENNPEKYTPQYGGFCSWGMRYNGRYIADHKVFTVYENKLYFNQDRRVKRWWERKRDKNISKGDENWKGLNN